MTEIRKLDNQLSSVGFTRDTVDIDFNGPVLRCNRYPTLLFNGVRFTQNDEVYIHKLCTYIAQISHTVTIESHITTIEFTNDRLTLEISSDDLEWIKPKWEK